jgi:hypothetical protein
MGPNETTAKLMTATKQKRNHGRSPFRGSRAGRRV